MRWGSQSLSEHVDILSGFAFKSEMFNSDSRGMPLVRIRDVVPGTTSTYYDGPYDDLFVINEGEILIGMDGEFNCAKWRGGPSLLNQRVCRIGCKSGELDEGYLFRFLPNALKQIEDRTSFATVKHLSAKDIRTISMPFPPLDEQRRLAAILDQADELRRHRREALGQLEKIIQADFISSFVCNHGQSWPEVSVDGVSNSIRTGPFGSQLLHSEFIKDGVAVLGIDNAVRNEFRWDERRYISETKYRELQRYRVFPRDLLITIMGTCGRAAIVPDDIPLAINTKHLCCLTLDENRCLPEFLHACFLRHPSVLHQLGVRERGAVMAGLNMGLIEETRLPLPPIDLQRAFAARVAEINKLRARHRAYLTKLDALFASLQYRAFRGEL